MIGSRCSRTARRRRDAFLVADRAAVDVGGLPGGTQAGYGGACVLIALAENAVGFRVFAGEARENG